MLYYYALHFEAGAVVTLEPREGSEPQMPPPPPPPSSAAADTILFADCLEVQDTHGLWAVARVLACIDDAVCGPLALVHFEGWSASWLMWLSRVHDRERVRPLGFEGGQISGLGSRGRHDRASLQNITEEAHDRIREGAAFEWRATGGQSYKTYPFRQQGAGATRFHLRPTGGGGHEQLEAFMARGLASHRFAECNQLVQDRARCEEEHQRFGV